jgi:hypothetical protein
MIGRYARDFDASLLKTKREEAIARAASKSCLRSSLRMVSTEANERWRDIEW